MRGWFRALHWLFLARAVLRGPGYFAAYEARRQARRALWRALRPRRRRRARRW